MEVKQINIARLAGVDKSTMSKYISTHKIPTIANRTAKRYDIESVRALIKGTSPYSKKKYSKKIHTFYNFKGGTGKSTLCHQVSHHLFLMGFNVLCIDLDPQGHLTDSISSQDFSNSATIYDILLNNESIENTIQTIHPGLDLIPANLNLTRINTPLEQKIKREEFLKKQLQLVSDNYDFILIDTNPSMSILNLNALVAADLIEVICETQYKSILGLKILMEEMASFSDDMNSNLMYRIVANKYEPKLISSQENLGVLRIEYPSYVFQSIVRRSEEINISSKNKLPVISFAGGKSSAIEDIVDLTHEILEISSI